MIKALHDENVEVRKYAIEALDKFGDKRAINQLVENLSNWYLGPLVLEVLQKLEWQPAVDKDEVRMNVAKRDKQSLLNNWTITREVLLADVASDNIEKIENSVYAFIGIGKEEILDELINILNKQGTRDIAVTFLNCGNERLSKAAEEWVSKHGYKIISSIYRGGGFGWGRMK